MRRNIASTLHEFFTYTVDLWHINVWQIVSQLYNSNRSSLSDFLLAH